MIRNISIQATLFQKHKKTVKNPLGFIHKKQFEDKHTLELLNVGRTLNLIHMHGLNKENIETERTMDRKKIEGHKSNLIIMTDKNIRYQLAVRKI